MTNLDSIFKSRDITLPTKVHLIKAMVFPVVMYECESWTVKKAECQRLKVSSVIHNGILKCWSGGMEECWWGRTLEWSKEECWWGGMPPRNGMAG